MRGWHNGTKSDITIFVRKFLRVSQGLLLTIVGRRGKHGILQRIKCDSVAIGDRMSKLEAEILGEIFGVLGGLPPPLLRNCRTMRVFVAYIGSILKYTFQTIDRKIRVSGDFG